MTENWFAKFSLLVDSVPGTLNMLNPLFRFFRLLAVVLGVCVFLNGSRRAEAQVTDDRASKLTSPGDADSEPKPRVGKYRFEPQPNREYLIQRARKESQARMELLQYYQAIGFNYAQPTFDGMAMHPYPISRKPFFVKPIRPW